MKPPYWHVEDPDGEDRMLVRADDEAGARAAAVEQWGEHAALATVRPWTADDDRLLRNAHARARYAVRQEAGTLPDRRRPVSEAAWAYLSGLTMVASLSIHDGEGRIRCPQCQRFAHPDDFVGAATSVRIAGACVDFGPACKRCRGSDEPSLNESAPSVHRGMG